MFITSYASLTKTGWIRVVKIVKLGIGMDWKEGEQRHFLSLFYCTSGICSKYNSLKFENQPVNEHMQMTDTFRKC